MKRDDILAAFRHFGMDQINIIADDRGAVHGPAIVCTPGVHVADIA